MSRVVYVQSGEKTRFISCKFLPFIYLLLFLFTQSSVFSAEQINEYIFLIDTSTSMNKGNLLSKLRVAVDDYADTIPIDGSSQIWIFTFDKGLKKTFFQRIIQTTKDLQDAKIVLHSQQAKGNHTWIFQALDEVFNKIDKTISDGHAHDFVVHLFTDGDDNGSERYTLAKNVARFINLRNANNKQLELYYHALELEISDSMKRQISDTEGMNLISGLGMPPKAKFSPSKVEVNDNTPITFVNKTTGNAERWLWEFGDGTTSNDESPTHTFQEPGKYSVKLTAVNPSGKTAAERLITIKGGPPVAKFTVENLDKPKYVEETVQFNDQSAGRIKRWDWKFGDGHEEHFDSKPGHVKHVYKQSGTYKVTLNLTGFYGNDSVSESVTISQRPILKFSFFPQNPRRNQEIKFSNESVGEYKEWFWDFDNGTKSNEHSPPVYKYKEVGTYKVTLSARDVNGELKEITKSVVVESDALKPVAKFTLPVESVEIGEVIKLSDQSIGTIEKWEWDMGDGKIIKTPIAEHTFMKAGTFTITLTVSGPLGTNSFKANLLVREVEMKFSVKPDPPVEGAPTVFVNESVGNFKNWLWNFGDGTKSNEKTPSHVFKNARDYTVSLSAEGPDNKPYTIKKKIEVKSSEAPVIDFQLIDGPKKKPSRPPVTIKLQNKSKGNIREYLWDFGDGKTSDDINPVHEYTKPGKYLITLKVIDRQGREFKSTSSQAIKITVLRPPIISRRIQWVLALALYLLLWLIVFKSQRYHKRNFRYQINAERKITHSKKTDKKFPWLNGEYLEKGGDSYTDGFEVIMVRDWLLRKRYYFKELKGDVKAVRRNGKPLKNDRLVKETVVTVRGTNETRFLRFNDGISSWLIPHLSILIIVAVFLALGFKFLG